jgi:hypothetical protein
MTRLRRRPGAVYRVYGEEEYLAGADALAAWVQPPADEPKHGRRLQRIAGAAALTGAVGTVGGVVGLAGVRAHAVDRREIAERIVPSMRATALRGSASTSAHAARRQILRPSRPRRTHAHRGMASSVSLAPALHTETTARAVAAIASRSMPARARRAALVTSTEAASGVQEAPAEAPGAVQETPPANPEARPRAQSEFGFER